MTRGHRLPGLKARREAGGFTIPALARAANLSDDIVNDLEAGGNCDPHVTQRILDALAPAVNITSNSQANPTVITTASAHGFQTGDTVTIAGVTGANANPNGSRVATRINATQFSVPVDSSLAGGTGGTATVDPVVVGLVRL